MGIEEIKEKLSALAKITSRWEAVAAAILALIAAQPFKDVVFGTKGVSAAWMEIAGNASALINNPFFRLLLLPLAVWLLWRAADKVVKAEEREGRHTRNVIEGSAQLPVLIERRNMQLRDIATLDQYIAAVNDQIERGQLMMQPWSGNDLICISNPSFPQTVQAPAPVPPGLVTDIPQFSGTISQAFPSMADNQPDSMTVRGRRLAGVYDPQGPENITYKKVQRQNLNELIEYKQQLGIARKRQEVFIHLCDEKIGIALKGLPPLDA
ncbi:hypothetical protein [Sphingobium sp. LSP13-1-1.1]|uniref:hypothetical protein n=1 Tax=Sphingobium sp. LSP13-1-1.1 TaxID=3135234 RepID=UPI003413E3BA